MKEDTNAARQRALAICQKVSRINIGIILAAFALILLLTTVSTAEWVRATGKGLYYVIVSQILASVGAWYYRTRLEKAQVEEGRSHGDH